MALMTDDVVAVQGASTASSRLGVGLGLALASATGFALSGPLARGLLDTGWNAAAVVLVRMTVAALVLLPFGVRALRGNWTALRQTWRTVLLYGALAVAGLGSAALLGYAVHVLRKVSISGKPSLADGNTSDESLAAKNEMTDPDAGLSPYDPDALVAQLKATPLVMRPGYHGAFYDARDGKLVQMPFFDDYTLDDDRDVSEWLALFFDLADHHDPARCALRNAADITKIEQAGLPIYRRLAARFGQDCIGFDPVAAPVLTHHQTASVKLMTDYPCDPLWLLGDEQCEPVSPDSFGISWQLARDITAWDAEADPDDQDNPSSTLQWSDAQLDAHEEKGRQLAVRLARELAATDRANVTVYNYHRNGGAREVRADDRIDATG